MRERIDTNEAIRLYHAWRNWREVALRLPRKTWMPFAADAVQSAVRRHDRNPWMLARLKARPSPIHHHDTEKHDA